MGAFCRVTGAAPPCPCALSALEEHNFLFQLQAPERPPEDAKEVGGPGGWGGVSVGVMGTWGGGGCEDPIWTPKAP